MGNHSVRSFAQLIHRILTGYPQPIVLDCGKLIPEPAGHEIRLTLIPARYPIATFCQNNDAIAEKCSVHPFGYRTHVRYARIGL